MELIIQAGNIRLREHHWSNAPFTSAIAFRQTPGDLWLAFASALSYTWYGGVYMHIIYALRNHLSSQ